MAKAIYTNFAKTTLTASLSAGATSATVADGSKFGSPSGGDWQVAVIDNGTAFEIVHITARSGGTLTITRAQESTSAASWSIGDTVLAPVTAAFCTPLSQIDLTTSIVTGALTAAKGGTGQSSYTIGDILYASATTALSKLGIGATNAILTVAGGLPAWTASPTIDLLTIGTALKGTATNPASAGVVRLGNTQSINWRDNGNSADYGISLDSSDIFILPGTPVRIANNKFLVGRDNANSANVNIFKVNTSDTVQFGNSATDQKFGFGGAPSFLFHVLGATGLKVANYSSGPTTIGDETIVTGDATGGAFTLNLPAVGSNTDRVLVVMKKDASGNAVTLSGNGANINGSASVSLSTQYDVAMVFCNGTEWFRIV